METKKQEAIRLAYGEYWEIVKDFVDENGWIKYTYSDKIEAGIEPFGKYQTKNHYMNQYEWRFISLDGLEDNNGWQSYENGNYPPIGTEVLLFNEKWIDEDFNPKGTRIGFKTDEDVFSAYWWDYQDTYMSISHYECDEDESFSHEFKNSIDPTHWKLIEDKKPIF